MSLAAYAQELLSTLHQSALLPGAIPLIPETFTPTTKLSVAFGEREVHLGNLFRASECKAAPTVSFPPEDPPKDSTYSLLLLDPDAPTPDDPKFAYWRHWVLSGLQPSQSQDAGTTLTEYLGPGPKDDSRPHRYLYLLFREPAGFGITKEDVGGEEFVDRRSFPAAEFVDKHGLELVGLNWMLGVGDGWSEETVGY